MPVSRAFVAVWSVRLCLVVLGVTLGILMLGPFSGVEARLGLSDKEGHTLAFFTLCALCLVALPRVRWMDIAILCLALGGMFEVLQPFMGREGSLYDWLADALGVGLCVVPMLAQSLRRQFRSESGENTPRRRRTDRIRKRRSGKRDEALGMTPAAIARLKAARAD